MISGIQPDQPFILDWVNIRPDVTNALLSGQARIFNGVARDVSDGHKILQHLPFRQIDASEFNGADQLSKTAARLSNLPGGEAVAAIQGALAISTAVTVGSVVLCTAYLAHKLNALEAKIECIQAELQNQNLLYYAARASAYFGAVEAAREIVARWQLVEENPDLVAQSISRLAGQRHETLAFLNHLFRLVPRLTPESQALALDFFHATLDFYPKAVFIESQAAYKLERFLLGDHIRQSSLLAYEECVGGYRTWANSELKKVISGAPASAGRLLQERMEDARRILGSPDDRVLLEQSV
jgi:hypothetical protein